jgi:hypothetical protein
MQKTLLFLFILSSFSALSQEIDSQNTKKSKRQLLKGKIIDGNTKNVLPNTHIINLNSVRGTTSNTEGHFRINVQANDTLYFSFLGYQSIKLKVTNDLLKGNDLEIAMFEYPVDLDEVLVKPYELIGVLEVDAKNVPIDKFARIHINGLPQTFEVGAPSQRKYTSPTDAIFHPVDFVYELFGKKPKQLRKLKMLRSEDALREMLEEKVNREVLMEYLEMDKTKLNSLLDHCNYSNYFIQKASDLQVIEAVLECYENYKALKKGSTRREQIKIE